MCSQASQTLAFIWPSSWQLSIPTPVPSKHFLILQKWHNHFTGLLKPGSGGHPLPPPPMIFSEPTQTLSGEEQACLHGQAGFVCLLNVSVLSAQLGGHHKCLSLPSHVFTCPINLTIAPHVSHPGDTSITRLHAEGGLLVTQ